MSDEVWVRRAASALVRDRGRPLAIAGVLSCVGCASPAVIEAPAHPVAEVDAVDQDAQTNAEQLAVQAEPDAEEKAKAQPEAEVLTCNAPEARQFDFWIGSWEVRRPDGSLAGRNEITRTHGGCVLEERYVAAHSGYEGSSLNVYDVRRGVWHQSWVDNGGLLLMLDGGSTKAGVMRLSGHTIEGERAGTGQTKVLQEITWTALEDGTVRQHWRSSRDGGQTWRDAFVGIYQRIASP